MKFILSGQPEPPLYFANMKKVNKYGLSFLKHIPMLMEFSVEDVALRMQKAEVLVLDTRPRDPFLQSHLRGSLFAPPKKFSDFAGSYISPADHIILVIPDVSEWDNYALQLIRIVFDNVIGFLPSYEVGAAPDEMKTSIRAIDFKEVPGLLNNGGGYEYLDVRKSTEFADSYIRQAKNIPHTRLGSRSDELTSGAINIVSCASGTRAAGACALLQKNGRKVICVADKFTNTPSELMD
jgi:hydroxyacylglutathione hydrolase